MSAISRTYTFTDGTTAFGSQVETEIGGIVTAFNNQDAGTNRWTVMDATTLKKGGITLTPIIQVLSFTTTTSTSTTSSTYQVTNLTKDITPNFTSSKILIIVSGMYRSTAVQTSGAFLTIKRGSTDLSTDAVNGLTSIQIPGGGLTGSFYAPASMVYLDSPSSVAALTYAVYIKNSDNLTSVRFGEVSMASIVLMEIGS